MLFLYFFRYLADTVPTDQRIASCQNHKLERNDNYDDYGKEDNKKVRSQQNVAQKLA